LSEDGETEILHFTKENSPLISNNIRSVAILGETGEVFVGTDKGLESFRYTATDPEEDYSQLKVFPNPVREDFDGLISISGLVDDSEVKITDSKGGLVYRTRSNGGTAVWDGCRFDGSRAASGVYFVHATDSEGRIKGSGKILLIK
ncbi:MAG: T9SS type A sorting domain-containing protein, partial [Bacteroidales bacterium]|nr:T9SS type A sorting domain-containing protein [Bacteroidales bacterium]